MAGARAMVKQADEKIKGGFLSCWAGTGRFEEASELYEQAANQYKLTKQWQEVADCWSQCAYCAQKTGDSNAEANSFQEAGNALRRISTSGAVEAYEQAIAVLSSSGSFSRAGKLLKSIAELHEQEKLDGTECKACWKRAAEMFELDDHSKSNISECNLKVAEYAAKDGELQEAIRLFEAEGEKALRVTALQYGAKEHFLRAGLVHLLVGDPVNVTLAVERYNALDPRFASSREGELLVGLAEAFEQSDGESFTERLQSFDSVTKLSAWKTDVLLKVRDAILPPNATSLESVDLT